MGRGLPRHRHQARPRSGPQGVAGRDGRKPGTPRAFRREAKALAALDHPGIVTVYSVEEAEVVPRRTARGQAGAPAASGRSCAGGAAWRGRHDDGGRPRVAGLARCPCEATFREPAAHEPAQYSLHHRPQQTVRLGEPLRIDAQKLLEVLLDHPEQRRLPSPLRPGSGQVRRWEPNGRPVQPRVPPARVGALGVRDGEVIV